MDEGHLPAGPPRRLGLGRFLRRLTWRSELGPVSAEANVEVRELEVAPPADPPVGRDEPGD
jgi:hypothetical protein